MTESDPDDKTKTEVDETEADETEAGKTDETDETAEEQGDTPADTETDETAESREARDETGDEPAGGRSFGWKRMLVFGLLPVVAVLLMVAAGYLKWVDGSARADDMARQQSVRAAEDATVALLSYRPETVEQQLSEARKFTTGGFRNFYTSLIHNVVIPGAKEKHVSAVANVPAGAPVSVDENHAVALLFVDQTVTVGTQAPTNTESRVRVTLDKVDGRWLVSGFEPV